jgi:hypothetical protein
VLCDCNGLLEIHTALNDEEDTTEEDKKTRQKTHTDDEGRSGFKRRGSLTPAHPSHPLLCQPTSHEHPRETMPTAQTSSAHPRP